MGMRGEYKMVNELYMNESTIIAGVMVEMHANGENACKCVKESNVRMWYSDV